MCGVLQDDEPQGDNHEPGASAHRSKVPALVVAHVNGGIIRYYATTNKFVGICGNDAHGVCVLSRGANGNSWAKGRPIGLIVAWLENHVSNKDDAGMWPDLEARTNGRDVIVDAATTHGHQWAQNLLRSEFQEELGWDKEPRDSH